MNKYLHRENIIIGITQGDFNGVSYELVIKTLKEEIVEAYTPVFFGSSKLVSYFRKIVSSQSFNFILSKEKNFVKRKPNLVNIYSPEVKVMLGNKTTEAAELAIISLDNSLEYAKSNLIDAIVCCPTTTGLINTIIPDFISSGKYFLNRCNVNNGMSIMCNESIKITSLELENNSKTTIDIVTTDYLTKKLKQLNQILKEDFMIEAPKIAVLAYNPVSLNGTFDKIEEQTIASAIDISMTDSKMFVYGPYDFNQLFLDREYLSFDAIITMTQQQANTIFTLLNGKDGYIYTAGLPFVVTETYHDSLYNIAGKDKADLTGFKQALFAAKQITENKKELLELSKNKLDNTITTDTNAD